MRLPRDLSGDDLVRKLRPLGYVPTRQTGNHIRLTRGAHHVTLPRHRTLRVGTLNSILGEVAAHLGLEKAALVRRLRDRPVFRDGQVEIPVQLRRAEKGGSSSEVARRPRLAAISPQLPTLARARVGT